MVDNMTTPIYYCTQSRYKKIMGIPSMNWAHTRFGLLNRWSWVCLLYIKNSTWKKKVTHCLCSIITLWKLSSSNFRWQFRIYSMVTKNKKELIASDSMSILSGLRKKMIKFSPHNYNNLSLVLVSFFVWI
jgi:hypothetical protein